jgi:DNA-binding GntR family transcriptional regulator
MMDAPPRAARKKRSLQGVTPMSHQRAAAPRAATLVYNALLDDIVSLRRKPMELLNEKELEAQFGVSRTPIREAIIRLADVGLVDVFPQSGTFVSRIPRRALYEAILVRKALEDTTVSIAVEKMTPAGLRSLERNLSDLAACHKDGDVAAFHVLDNAFHQQISTIAGFPGIWTIIQQVKVHSDRYRLLTLPQEGRLARVVEEHAAIIDRMRAGDRQGATAAMEFHLGRLLREVDRAEIWDPAYFIEDAAPSRASQDEKDIPDAD